MHKLLKTQFHVSNMFLVFFLLDTGGIQYLCYGSNGKRPQQIT